MGPGDFYAPPLPNVAYMGGLETGACYQVRTTHKAFLTDGSLLSGTSTSVIVCLSS